MSEIGTNLQPRVNDLINGVVWASAEPLPKANVWPVLALLGSDHGLYARLSSLAARWGETVADDDIAQELLKDGNDGLRYEFSFGWTNVVKQAEPLQMTAVLVHEMAHRFTEPVRNAQQEALSETIAEGAAFVVCDHFGLDIERKSSLYIANFNHGHFTKEMIDGIKYAGAAILDGLCAE